MSNWRSARPALPREALFNAALCWLRLDHAAEFAADYREISNDPAQARRCRENCSSRKAPSRRRREKRKRPRLCKSSFAIFRKAHGSRRHGSSSRRWLFTRPGRTSRRHERIWRRRAREHPTPAALERADYLQIWLEDATSLGRRRGGHHGGQQVSRGNIRIRVSWRKCG